MIHGNWLAKWAPVVPDKPAVIDLATDRRVSFSQLNRSVDKLAHGLSKRFGVRPGDRVAVLGPNRLEHVQLFFALAKLGAVLVPINYRMAPDEIAYVLRDSDPSVLFYDSEMTDVIQALAAGLWKGRQASLDGAMDPVSGGPGFQDWLEDQSGDPVETEGLRDDSPVMLLYTSGTTGRPKGAVLTHGSITWNAINTATSWDLTHDDVSLVHTPFFHTGGWNVLTLPLLHRGASVVLMKKFDADETLRAIERFGLTVLFAVPTMFQMMLDSPIFDSIDFSSLRFFISGGAPCPVPLIEAFQKKNLVFKQGYGLTEVGPNCFVLNEQDAVRKAGSVGFPVLHLDTRVVAENNRLVGVDEVGELQLRGPTVCAGYWNNPEATRQALSDDGWFATGDLFRIDADGYHYVVGRSKEMYISGGENVYPAEVERVLYQLPTVVEVAVIGVPDDKWGEVGHAFVALDRNGSGMSEDDLLDHCRQHLAKYKVPKRLTILDSLPKGPSGKIWKKELQKLDQIHG